ncbi:MAG: glycogen/starch/alpha-glucan phosphorylase [Gammaproteobacteria bacterium]|nr:glycogen/starch/alpha-glucan phosphorylase [Gammaproteobacteria bacterium]MDE2348980.1 glycogen/starch/alpha-glucan phosphorylase [Gammaproteobacteria bacterium]
MMNTAVSQISTRRSVALQPGMLHAALLDRLTRALGKHLETASARDLYDALSLAVREELTLRWLSSQRRVSRAHVKRVCYLSVEYLPGSSLMNALGSLGGDFLQEARATLRAMGHELDEVAAQEVDPGLGNGGLGRLAACFMDSLATLQYPAVGYGIRYDYGIFTQVIDEDGAQREVASSWLRLRNPWETPRGNVRYTVRFGGRSEAAPGADPAAPHRWVGTRDIYAIGFDQLIPGNRCTTVNHLRLWSGRGITPFDIDAFNDGDYAAAVRDQVDAKNLSRVLYPDDTTQQGKELRLKQQYFFASASLQDILATHAAEGRTLESLPDAIAIQLNDTHPTVAIPELMRLLVDERGLPWADAWRITTAVFSYTNHTLLPEALETWPVSMYERLLPRHLEIIYLINKEFLAGVHAAFPGDVERQRRLSIITEDGERRVRMAHLAVIGSHRVNGVARLHSELMRKNVFAGFAELYPERFINVTNGIAVRRWLKQSNPGLSALFTEHIGVGWENDLEDIGRLIGAAEDPQFRARFRSIKRANKERLAAELERRIGVRVGVDSLFDVQVKRIHEYKRQTLNLLYVIARYIRIRENPGADILPRTVVFAGKAAPGYAIAKSIIKLINNVARTVNADPAAAGKLCIAFLPDYDVSLAQKIIPAADLSQQISTAGLEASGTGNMKLALNGALTIGTLDGANIEIRDHVGAENIFIFGLDAEGVVRRRAAGYRPRAEVDANPELARVLEMIRSGHFSPDRPGEAAPIVERLLADDEPYLVLADFAAYCEAQERVDELYRREDDWSRKAALNSLNMGYFSSDRSVREYADWIWGVKPVI